MGNGEGENEMSETKKEDEEGLAGAAETAGEGAGEGAEEPPRIGHTAADSRTSDDPDADVVDDPADVDYVELVKVHNCRDRHEARLVKGILEDAEIPCALEDDVTETLEGLTGAHLDGIDVFVPADYDKKALQVLADNGIIVGVDETRIQAVLGEDLDKALGGDGAARTALARALGEQTRDLRHEALARLGRRGAAGLGLAHALLRDAVRAPEDTPLAGDVATLADQGAFGKDAPLLFVNDLAKLDKEKEPRVRARVARALGRLRGAGAAAPLVDLLSDDDATVRDEALEGLYALSGGETFDFDPELSPGAQEPAVVAWRAWLRDNPGA